MVFKVWVPVFFHGAEAMVAASRNDAMRTEAVSKALKDGDLAMGFISG